MKDLAGKVQKPADLDNVAKPRGFTVGETPFFARNEPVAGLGMSPAVGARAFDLKDNEVSEAVQYAAGLRIPHRHRQAGREDAVAGRGEGEGARRRRQAEGGRDREAESGFRIGAR